MKRFFSLLVVCILLSTAVSLVIPFAAAEEKVPVIIGFTDHPDEKLVKMYGGEIKHSYTITPAISAKVPTRAIEALKANKHIEFVEPDSPVASDLVPDDPYYGNLWGLDNIGQTGGTNDADIDAPEVWDLQTGSQDIVVAVIDSGVDYDHPDLAANMWTNSGEIAGNGVDDDNNGFVDDVHGWDFAYDDNDPMDAYSHGTHCAGTIAAVGDNGIGVTGVNWNAKIMAMKFLSDGGSGWTSDAILAIEYVTMMKRDFNVPVIATSNSWGGGGYSQALYDAITVADSEGILFVAAAGNTGVNNDVTPHYPSSYDLPNVIAVAATDHNDLLANTETWSSCYGAVSVDLAAPGATILSTMPNNGYAYKSGTSMATPHVTGVVALLKAHNPSYLHSEIRDAILGTVDPIPALSGKVATGGRLNALGALQAGDGGDPIAAAGPDQTASDADGNLFEPCTLDASGSYDLDGYIVSYLWKENDQTIGTGVSFSSDFGIGIHTVTLTVTDNDGLTDSDDVTLNVAPNAPPVASAGYDLTVTDDDGDSYESLNVDGSGSYDPDGSIVAYEWRRDGTLISSAFSFARDFAVGIHTLELTVIDNGGGVGTDTTMIKVDPKLPETTTLAVVDGYDEYEGRTLDDLGTTPRVQTSDNSRIIIQNGYYTSFSFTDPGFSSGVNIDSVIFHVEHYENGGFGSGNLVWSIGTNWPSNPVTWSSITAQLKVGKNSEGYTGWDITHLVDSIETLNSMELCVQNNDRRKAANIDHIYADVRYSYGPPNESPTADPQSVKVNEDLSVPITLTGSDPEGDPLTYAVGSQPSHGTLSGTAPAMTYDPDPDFHGTDSFTFTVNDGHTDSAIATVSITVTAINDAPVADDQSVTTIIDTPASPTLTGSDVDGDGLTYLITGGPSSGTISGTAPALTYTPDPGFSGTDSFTFFVNDGSLDSPVATVTIEVVQELASNEMHVGSIEMFLNVRIAGRHTFISAYAVVTILDANDDPVGGATVNAHWSGATSDDDTVMTQADGRVTILSNERKNPKSRTTFTITVDDIILSGWVYDPASNIVTTMGITV